MSEFRTQQERDAAAQALSYQTRKPTQWTSVPPALSGRQVEGASMLPLGRYEMPDGSSQVSFGLPQGPLDAYRSMRYGLGYEQDPAAPPGYVSEDAMLRGALGASGAMATGGIAATTAARAAGRPMVPNNSVGVFGFGRRRNSDASLPDLPPIKRHKYMDGDGLITSRDIGDTRRIVSSYLKEDLRGKGNGLNMYRDVIDDAHTKGLHVTSDDDLSSSAAAVYEQLKKLGYDVRRDPKAKKIRDGKEDFYLSDSHVYRVAKPGTPGTEFFSSGIPGLHATEDEY